MTDASVVIPVHNKANELRFTLNALRSQTLPEASFEIIVVNDGSTDDTHLIANSFDDITNLTYIELTEGKGSVAKARNAGIRKAKSDVVIFLDADVIPAPKLIEGHLQTHDTYDNTIVLGPVFAAEITPDVWPLWITRPEEWDFGNVVDLFKRVDAVDCLRDQREPIFRAAERGEINLPAPWTYFWTVNVSAKKTKLEAVGLFDERFDGKGSEDLELGYRLHQFGCITKMDWKAQGFHQPHVRNRTQQILKDRLHEAYFLKKFPVLEVEMLVAFDCGNMNAILPALETLGDGNLLTKHPVYDIDLSTTSFSKSHKPNLLVGAGTGNLLRNECFTHALELNKEAVRFIRRRFPNVHVYNLLGVALPFDDNTFGAVIITDLWRYLPERLIARMLQESLRVGKRVFLMKTQNWKASPVDGLNEILHLHDHPYWECYIYLSRTFHDFSFRPINSPVQQNVLLIEVFAKELGYVKRQLLDTSF